MPQSFWFFETGFLCMTILAVLELALYVDQAGLELTAICLPSDAEDKPKALTIIVKNSTN